MAQQANAILLISFVTAVLAAPLAGAQDKERSGKQVVDQVCASCHATGANGAPKIGDTDAWSKRASRGLSSLTKSALNGIRKMPPHGGNPEVSDLEIKRAIAYMVNQSGGHWVEPVGSKPRAERSGQAIVKAQCIKCHGSGKGGAPKLGDRAAWSERVKPGVDTLVRSAINGHGGMPARGGMANLTDAEIKNAVNYMVTTSIAPRKGE
ncbi:MAG TPA: c-type cytochrome [Burkholderiales bacterium]|nr:c-type cytochrome [Burkholderiales bacterium]